MTNTDTIVAIATAYGVGSIAIVRLSGDEAKSILEKTTQKNNYTPRLATLTKFYANDELVDELLAIYFKAPYSFTSEDIVEFQCHGGIAVAKMIVNECLRLGARLATGGEFSKRAFLNGKMDLSKAETIAKMIEAKSSDSVKLLAKQLKGELKEFVDEIRESLIKALAFSEVCIDYADEDLPDDIALQIEKNLTAIKFKLQDALNSSKRREGVLNGFKVAIVGKPNVGKSSLLNKILNYDRAIVSDIAGTTRDTIEESVTIGTHLIKIVDTAGIRDASDEIEKIGIQRSKQSIEEADIVIALFDNSTDISNEDKEIIELLNSSDKDKVVVLNKIDLESKFDTTTISKYEPIELSCKDSIDELADYLETMLDTKNSSEDVMLISTRQIDIVQKTLNLVEESEMFLANLELEIFSFHINDAIKSISDITKQYDNDEMFDSMFSNFCLGK
jgi:tRNA modification GTPase